MDLDRRGIVMSLCVLSLAWNILTLIKRQKRNTVRKYFSIFCLMSVLSSQYEDSFYRLNGTDIESPKGEICRTRPDGSWGPPSLLYNGYRVFPGGKAAGAWYWPPIPF
jgi:hypothetical protein